MPPPWTQQRKQREAESILSSLGEVEGLPTSVLILLFVLQESHPHWDSQPRASEMETRKEQRASSWAINRAARAHPGLGEAPRLSGGMVLELRGLGGYSGILPAHLPLLCTAESTQAA